MLDEIVDNFTSDDDDDIFILDIIQTIPRIRMYHDRPDLFNSYNDTEFRNRFRFSKESVVRLNELLFEFLEPATNKCKSLSSMIQVLIALRFLATGCFQMTAGDLFNCHQATISRILPRVLQKIAEFANESRVISMPQTQEELINAKLEFNKIANFPGVIGTIDCTRIKIQRPTCNNPEWYRNRKTYFSINVQAIGGANLEILDLEARWPGSVHDQTILDASFIKAKLENDEFANCVILGDRGYALRRYLITPLANPVSNSEKRFQRAHLKIRNSIERLFGVWKRRFPTLALGFRVKTSTTLTAIVASAVLHNLSITLNDGVDDFEEIEDLGNFDLPPIDAVHAHRNSSVRDSLILNYFNN